MIAPVARAKPARPAGVVLYDEPWKNCGRKVCLTPGEVARSQENKVEIKGWMDKTNNLLDYYEDEGVSSGSPQSASK